MVLDPDAGVCWQLNKTGAAIWHDLISGVALEDVALRLSQREGIDEARALEDARSLASDLTHANLLEVAP